MGSLVLAGFDVSVDLSCACTDVTENKQTNAIPRKRAVFKKQETKRQSSIQYKDTSTMRPVTMFAQILELPPACKALYKKSKSHPRQWVDGSDPFYKTEKNDPSADCEVHAYLAGIAEPSFIALTLGLFLL
jgi:hypothetical protein